MKKSTGLASAFLAVSLLGSAPAYAEYNNLLRNIHNAVEANAKAKARNQGKFVSNVVTGFVGAVVQAAPFPENVGEVASTSLKKFPEYVGTAVGNTWQNYAEKTLTAKGRAEVKANEPQIRSQYNAAQAQNAANADYAAKQKVIADRRAKTYGPPKPNAFY